MDNGGRLRCGKIIPIYPMTTEAITLRILGVSGVLGVDLLSALMDNEADQVERERFMGDWRRSAHVGSGVGNKRPKRP